MQPVFVSQGDDQKGMLALMALQKIGAQTRALKVGETAAEGTVAIFTYVPSTTCGYHYFRTASIYLGDVTPEWAKTTLLRVGVINTDDRMPIAKKRHTPSTFALAARNLLHMYQLWNPGDTKQLVPWADVAPRNRSVGQSYWAVARAWHEEVLQTKTGSQAQAQLLRALAIREHLNDQGGYFVGEPTNAMLISPDAFLLTTAEAQICATNGSVIFDLWRQMQTLYRKAVLGQLPQGVNELVLQMVEGALESHQQRIQQRVALSMDALPYLSRADLTSVWFLVEIQERLGGLGLISSWLNAIGKAMPSGNGLGTTIGANIADTLSDVIRSSTGMDDPVAVLICPEKYVSEQEYLARLLNANGILTFVVRKDEIETKLRFAGNKVYCYGYEVHFLYRREVAAYTLADSPMGLGIVEANLAGNLVVEPPLNMMYDGKGQLALVHDPQTAEHFTDAVRAIVPPTAVFPKSWYEPFWLGGKQMTLDQVKGMGLVVKYAGPNIFYGLGARAVFNTRNDTDGVVRGLAEVRAGHPWIIQQMDETRHQATWLDREEEQIRTGDVAGRLMMHYVRKPNNKVEIFAATATNRTNGWKAAGNVDSLFQEIRVV